MALDKLDKNVKKEVEYLDKIADTQPTTEPKTKVTIKGSVILNIMLGALVVFLALMLGKSQGCCTAPVEPDTTNFIGKVDRPFKPPKLPKEAHALKPAIDTSWLTDTLYLPLPMLRVQIVDYRDRSLKVAAVKPTGTVYTVKSYTWYAPSGFQLRVVGDSIEVDTFPSPYTPQKIKPDLWTWFVDLDFNLVQFDTTLAFGVTPALAVGGELGPLRLGRAYLSWTAAKITWSGQFANRHAALVASSGVKVEF